ncbi:MAG: class IV adenylate cyclase [Candidatus Micrarchaeota archaeon]
MNEIEVKVLEINKMQVLARLKKLKAKKIFSGVLKTIYFDFPGRHLSKNGQVLRLRQTTAKTFLTFKTRLPTQKSVSSEEIEFEVSDWSDCQRFIRRLGFRPVLSYSKKRESYRLGKNRIELDKFLGAFKKIPLFLEIEATSEKQLFVTFSKLGFSKADAKAWHTGQLLAHYGIKE